MSKKQKRIGIFIALFFLAIGLYYSYCTPLWSPPDEERHFAYCEYIAQNHKLPYLNPDDEGFRITQAIHPPLYYLIGSLFFGDDKEPIQKKVLINDGPGFNTITSSKAGTVQGSSGEARTAYLLRLFSIVLSAANIYLIYLLALHIFPNETFFASCTALFAAMNPQFLHISASISNENLSTVLSTLYLTALLRYLKNSVKITHHITTGFLLGCCLLSKFSTIIFLPVTVSIIAWVSRRDRTNLIISLFVILGLSTLVGGWWYFRNWLLFNDPMFSKAIETIQPWSMHSTPLSLSYVVTVIGKTFTSFWGHFGALQFSIPKVHLAIYGGIIVLGIAGFCRLLVKRKLTTFQGQALGILFLSLLGGVGIYVLLNIRYIMPMGRYLFVVIAPIAIITCVGFQSLFPSRWRNPVLILLSFVLIVMNLDVLFRVLKPAYAETFLVAGVDQPQFCCPTPEINLKSTISQTFISPKNNLCAIRVMFSCPVKKLKGDITFALKEAGDAGKILHQMHYSLKEINDSDRCCFIFPPIPNSRGKEYMFTFSSPSLPTGKGISLWYNTSGSGAWGRMLINGNPTPGNLYFQVYCFAGERPATDWQGRRETVINQGWYLSLREIQLYAEMSKEFRVKTLLHEKLQRIEKALKNRISS